MADPTATPTGDTPAQVSAPDSTPSNTQVDATADPSTDAASKSEPEGNSPASGDDASTASGDDADAEVELDETTLQAIASLYGDKLLSTPELKAEFEKRVQDAARTERQQIQRAQSVSAEVQTYVERGRTAVEGMNALAEAAENALKEASKLPDANVDPAIFSKEKLGTYIRDFSDAIVAEMAHSYDRALDDGFTAVLANRLPPLTTEEAQELTDLVFTRQRMEGDAKQADKAQTTFYQGLFDLTYRKAFMAGAAAEQARGSTKSAAAKKIAESNAVKAAAAKLAAQRGEPPPRTPGKGSAGTESAPPGEYNSEYYLGLKRAGKIDEAQAYATRFATRTPVKR